MSRPAEQEPSNNDTGDAQQQQQSRRRDEMAELRGTIRRHSASNEQQHSSSLLPMCRQRLAALEEEERTVAVQQEALASGQVIALHYDRTTALSLASSSSDSCCPLCRGPIIAAMISSRSPSRADDAAVAPFGRFFCCGTAVCNACFDAANTTKPTITTIPPLPSLNSCPVCHAAFPSSETELTARVRHHAEHNNQPWAQEELACRLLLKQNSISITDTNNGSTTKAASVGTNHYHYNGLLEEAHGWRQRAAGNGNGNAVAQYHLGMVHCRGHPELRLWPDMAIAAQYLECAARQGLAAAKVALADICSKFPMSSSSSSSSQQQWQVSNNNDSHRNDNDNNQNRDQAAVRWWTLAAAQGSAEAQLQLAHAHAAANVAVVTVTDDDDVPDSSMTTTTTSSPSSCYDKAVYWAQLAAQRGWPEAQYWTARYMVLAASASNNNHESSVVVEEGDNNEHNNNTSDVPPLALRWAKMAVLGCNNSIGDGDLAVVHNYQRFAAHLEQRVLSQCAHCRAEAVNLQWTQPPLQICGNCEAVAYCGRSCQRQHWKRQHQPECLAVQEQMTVEATTTPTTTTTITMQQQQQAPN